MSATLASHLLIGAVESPVPQDAELFLGIAGIAGVFVGFAALISFTGHTDFESAHHIQVRGVVSIGLLVIVAALVPIGIRRYGVSGHDLWLVCSIVFLVLLWSSFLFAGRRPENRALMVAQFREAPKITAAFWVLLEAPIQIPLILTVIGTFPEMEPAFYATALIVQLFEAVFVLAQLVYSRMFVPEA